MKNESKNIVDPNALTNILDPTLLVKPNKMFLNSIKIQIEFGVPCKESTWY